MPPRFRKGFATHVHTNKSIERLPAENAFLIGLATALVAARFPLQYGRRTVPVVFGEMASYLVEELREGITPWLQLRRGVNRSANVFEHLHDAVCIHRNLGDVVAVPVPRVLVRFTYGGSNV